MFARKTRTELPLAKSNVETLGLSTLNPPQRRWENNNPHRNSDIMQFKNTKQICDGLRLILGMPEMCDVKFLVGENKTPVYAVKAILATRSKTFSNMIQSHQSISDAKAAVPKKNKSFISKLKHLSLNNLSLLRVKNCEKSSTQSGNLVIPVTDFKLDIFRRVILFLHSGSVNVDIHSVVGVMTAADVYGIGSLRNACLQFAVRYISLKTVLTLLASAELYMHFRCTSLLLTKVMDFIAVRADDILTLTEFKHLPKKSVTAILFRRDLQTTEERKWEAAVQWCRHYCHRQEISVFKETIAIFIPHIVFVKISCSKLKRDIIPMNVLPDNVHQVVMSMVWAPPKPPRQYTRRSL